MRNRHYLLTDVVLLSVALYASFWLRLERFDIAPYWPGFVALLLISLPLFLATFRWNGVYSRYWRYASAEEVLLLFRSVALATLLSVLTTAIAARFLIADAAYPRSVPIIFFLLALAVTAGPRLMVRWLSRREMVRQRLPNPKRVVVIGAGDAGAMIVREMQNNPQLGMLPVGFIDDDPLKQGVQIHGVAVLGPRTEIPAVKKSQRVQQVIIAIPSAPGSQVRELTRICHEAQLPTKTMPGMYELLGGRLSVNQLRNVEIADLLRREPVKTDNAAISDLIKNRVVLVTGGGGSIGSELCRQILRARPKRLVLIGHGENSIFVIENELKRMAVELGLQTEQVSGVIADIQFAARIERVFQAYRPNVVFHAAAHKHVPLMERNPVEAVSNNVFGTRNVVNAALKTGVARFVMISTDKAVNPTNVMGASKRAAELLVHQAALQSGKPFVAVRFGNVLGSRGSVVLTFQKQIAAGGPVTVTHPEMTRFFMTIPEAVQLVLQAAVLGHGGEVFVLDMGEPVKIVDLAHDLIELSGLAVGDDIDIEYVGLRPGEKLFEELFIEGERYERTEHEKIFIARNASTLVPTNLNHALASLEKAANEGDRTTIFSLLRQLVPEYAPARAGRGTKAEASSDGYLNGAELIVH